MAFHTNVNRNLNLYNEHTKSKRLHFRLCTIEEWRVRCDIMVNQLAKKTTNTINNSEQKGWEKTKILSIHWPSIRCTVHTHTQSNICTRCICTQRYLCVCVWKRQIHNVQTPKTYRWRWLTVLSKNENFNK